MTDVPSRAGHDEYQATQTYYLSAWGLFFKLSTLAVMGACLLLNIPAWSAFKMDWGTIEHQAFVLVIDIAAPFMLIDLVRLLPCSVLFRERPLLVVTEAEIAHAYFCIPWSAVKSVSGSDGMRRTWPQIRLAVDDSRKWASERANWFKKTFNTHSLNFNWSHLTPHKSFHEWDELCLSRARKAAGWQV